MLDFTTISLMNALSDSDYRLVFDMFSVFVFGREISGVNLRFVVEVAYDLDRVIDVKDLNIIFVC